MLKLIVDFGTLLIGGEGGKTPKGCGSPNRPRLELKSTGKFNKTYLFNQNLLSFF
ncbi:hypothetical protein KW850_16220 [Bacillus sp. sid0103]|uniref:hypothetical protein n=1 Tax=Bacillus sp. sid0103 TaxID=2856337 RepID=UPI001C469CAF|nr:hypothetical protein [Bacillus sp. sid0103]MBV7506810.1 hypothetical protein [Bacillus sp. sid0103]